MKKTKMSKKWAYLKSRYTIGRSKELEEENKQVKKLVADLSLDKQMLQDVLTKKVLKPGQLTKFAEHLEQAYQVSVCRRCSVLCMSRSSYYYKSIRFVFVSERLLKLGCDMAPKNICFTAQGRMVCEA